MGQITIQFSGSYSQKQTKRFSAIHGGHATAIAEAIEWLSSYALPKAISQDHTLQEQGHYPEAGFGVTLADWNENRVQK